VSHNCLVTLRRARWLILQAVLRCTVVTSRLTESKSITGGFDPPCLPQRPGPSFSFPFPSSRSTVWCHIHTLRRHPVGREQLRKYWEKACTKCRQPRLHTEECACFVLYLRASSHLCCSQCLSYILYVHRADPHSPNPRFVPLHSSQP